MRDLNFDLKNICQRLPQGSFATRGDRFAGLQLIAHQLLELGYRLPSARSIKPKHVTALVGRWQGEGLSTGTIKNRMGYLRWWTEQVGKQSIMAPTNDDYGIARREREGRSRAFKLDLDKLASIPDPHIRMALRLQAAFGLRREEALKFRPALADCGDGIALKASWCKGGRARWVPIVTERQRALLDEAKALAGDGSLIPVGLTYIRQLKRYIDLTLKAGLRNTHGLRHAWAQWRYRTLTGWPAPAAGGPRVPAMTPEQRARDLAARLQVSEELGHGRVDVTAAYLGGRS